MSEHIDPYDDKNKARLNTELKLKKPDYKEAVDQIEQALAGNDPAPLDILNNATPTSIENTDSTQSELNNSSLSAVKSENSISQEAENNKSDADESQLHIAENVPKSTPAPKKRPPPKAIITPKLEKMDTDSVIIEAKEPPNDEKVSRSGRKIKEKKMNNDEMDPDEMFTQPRKRLKPDESKQVKTPQVNINDPNTITDFCISKMHLLQDPLRKNFLMTQYEIINAIKDIKLALGLERVEIEKAITILLNVKEKILPNITKLMLLKYADIIITIKRLRNYIGNASLWNLEEEQLKNFKDKAREIRSISVDIYDYFKVHLKIN
jgi:hypothetical protein